MALLAEAGIKVSSSKRTLLVQSSNFPVEILYLRDDDIPQSVATGVADLGIVGENEFVERGEDAEVVRRLGFSKCRLSLAIPKAIDYPGVEWFEVKKINEDSIEAELTNDPYYVSSIKKGDVATYPIDMITDWILFTKEYRITPDDVYLLDN